MKGESESVASDGRVKRLGGILATVGIVMLSIVVTVSCAPSAPASSPGASRAGSSFQGTEIPVLVDAADFELTDQTAPRCRLPDSAVKWGS